MMQIFSGIDSRGTGETEMKHFPGEITFEMVREYEVSDAKRARFSTKKERAARDAEAKRWAVECDEDPFAEFNVKIG